jgi:cell wall-associated NlpC family hydrolase
MKVMRKEFVFLYFVCFFVSACNEQEETITKDTELHTDTAIAEANFVEDSVVMDASVQLYRDSIQTGNLKPAMLVDFAKTLIAVPYKYASVDPKEGFDCSGYITYIFNHFNIAVPRSSVDFTNVGKKIEVENAKPGDLILFTGTDPSIRTVGHMGLIISNDNKELNFIHASSGKADGVVITPLNDYYNGRFVKVIRVFPDAYF